MSLSATELRRNVYYILDQVLETGSAVEITRKGRRLRIIPADGGNPLDRLRPLEDLIVGDPEEFTHLDWSDEWQP